MPVQPLPEGYHSATPYLIVKGAARAIDYYKSVFGATELMRFPDPAGRVAHAEIKIGDSVIMLADEYPEMGSKSPETLGGTAVGLMLYVPDVDAVFQRAIDAGATQVKPVKDQFYGDRTGTLNDPFGHQWTISTHVEDVSIEEVQRRMKAMTAAAGA